MLVIEDLTIANMVRRAKRVPDPDNPGQFLPNGARAKSGLNRSISDAGWGQFVSLLRAKAEETGRTLIEVDPRHTSNGCEAWGMPHHKMVSPRRSSPVSVAVTARWQTSMPHATSCGLDSPVAR